MAAHDLCTVPDVKEFRAIAHNQDDALIGTLIGVASRWLMAEVGRQLYPDGATSTRKFLPPTWGETLFVDDISTLTGLVVVDHGATLTIDSDFYAAPLNGKTPGGEPAPWYQLVRYSGQTWTRPGQGGSISVTAAWGFPAVPSLAKQAAIETTADLLQVRSNTFGILSVVDAVTAVRLRTNSHVAELVHTYKRGDRAPGFGIA